MPCMANVLTMMRHEASVAYADFNRTFYKVEELIKDLDPEMREKVAALIKKGFQDGFMECYLTHVAKDEENGHDDAD